MSATEFRCSFCGDEASEDDDKGRVLVVAENAAICELCALQAFRQVVAYRSAEREYLSWGRSDETA